MDHKIYEFYQPLHRKHQRPLGTCLIIFMLATFVMGSIIYFTFTFTAESEINSLPTRLVLKPKSQSQYTHGLFQKVKRKSNHEPISPNLLIKNGTEKESDESIDISHVTDNPEKFDTFDSNNISENLNFVHVDNDLNDNLKADDSIEQSEDEIVESFDTKLDSENDSDVNSDDKSIQNIDE